VLDPSNPFVQLLYVLGEILGIVVQWLAAWSLLIVWVVWWLWGANWKKIWPVLAGGAWAPVVLLLVVAALVWSQIAPTAGLLFGFIPVGNFWYQLGWVCSLAALALFCGWLQGILHWAPAEIELEPAAAHGHGHQHGHTATHASH
jgi:hypothetical protein